MKKCSAENHVFPKRTPTLGRRVHVLRDKPCQCGKYKNVYESAKEQAEKLGKMIEATR